MDIKVLNAEKTHIHDIFLLLNELADFKHLKADLKVDEARLCELIFDKKCLKSLVAEVDGEIIGTVLYYTSGISTFSGKNILNIDEIYVKKDFRKQGTGREFFKRLRSEAQLYNCCKIEWKCQSWNVDAGNFYKIMGSKQEDGWTGFSINHL